MGSSISSMSGVLEDVSVSSDSITIQKFDLIFHEKRGFEKTGARSSGPLFQEDLLGIPMLRISSATDIPSQSTLESRLGLNKKHLNVQKVHPANAEDKWYNIWLSAIV